MTNSRESRLDSLEERPPLSVTAGDTEVAVEAAVPAQICSEIITARLSRSNLLPAGNHGGGVFPVDYPFGGTAGIAPSLRTCGMNMISAGGSPVLNEKNMRKVSGLSPGNRITEYSL